MNIHFVKLAWRTDAMFLVNSQLPVVNFINTRWRHVTVVKIQKDPVHHIPFFLQKF